jgi:hypothetical protein
LPEAYAASTFGGLVVSSPRGDQAFGHRAVNNSLVSPEGCTCVITGTGAGRIGIEEGTAIWSDHTRHPKSAASLLLTASAYFLPIATSCSIICVSTVSFYLCWCGAVRIGSLFGDNPEAIHTVLTAAKAGFLPVVFQFISQIIIDCDFANWRL